MSTTIEDLALEQNETSPVQYQTEDGSPNVALLQDRSPKWMRSSRAALVLTSALGILFLFASYMIPIWHTDIWGHLSYGRWIWEHGQLPDTEPLMPLSIGVSMIDTAWLSQLGSYLLYGAVGVSGIKFIFAASIVMTAGCISIPLLKRTNNLWAALLSVGVFFWVDYQQLLIVRPQLAGLVCFAAIFAMATSYRWRRAYTILIPLLFVLWANLHGSFVVGIAVLGALCVGRAIDVYLKTKRLKLVFAERRTRELFLVTELAAAAALINPYGLAIYSEVFAISSNTNLQSLLEWDPLTLRMKQGRAAAAIALSLVFLYRLSPRRVSFSEVLILVGLGGGALWTSRMIVWWAPVAAYYASLHLAAVWANWRGFPTVAERKGSTTIALLGILWIFIAISPMADAVRHGVPKDHKQALAKLRKNVSTGTPLDAVEYLKDNPPVGQIFNTYEWGDYLLWAGPKDLQVFVASHAHLIPTEVWNDYLQIQATAGNWSDKLDRYGVNAVVIDKQGRSNLIEALEGLPAIWEKKFANNTGAVFYRKKPI